MPVAEGSGSVYEMELEPSSAGGACAQAPPKLRPRRSASKPRRARPLAAKPDHAAALHQLAGSIAAMRGFDEVNLDLDCRLEGVTHRGTVRFKVLHVEQLTASMLDRWRLLCSSRGYLPRIAVSTSTSEVNITCTPLSASADGAVAACKAWGAALHPLTLCFWVLAALNLLRHAYD